MAVSTLGAGHIGDICIDSGAGETPRSSVHLKSRPSCYLALNTQTSYVQQVSLFARHFNKSPEQLGPEDIRTYQVYLTNEKKLAPSSVLIAVSALRFLFKVSLKKDWTFEDIIPAPKKPQKLPVVLSPEEVLQFLGCVSSTKHRAILTTCYAAGLRISETVHLKPTDLDSHISTVAGTGWDLSGLSANLSYLEGLAVDGAGNVFMTLATYSVVLRLDTNGQLSLVAGNGTSGFSGDGGPAMQAQLSGPTAVAVDAAGNVYIEDAGNNRIRMVSNGIITTIAGGGTGDDGPATSASLNFEFVSPSLTLDRSGNIYFADYSRLFRDPQSIERNHHHGGRRRVFRRG